MRPLVLAHLSHSTRNWPHRPDGLAGASLLCPIRQAANGRRFHPRIASYRRSAVATRDGNGTNEGLKPGAKQPLVLDWLNLPYFKNFNLRALNSTADRGYIGHRKEVNAITRGRDETMKKKHVPQPDSEEGQILILFALFSFVLVGMLALSIDVGYLLSERRMVQNAVDAAATAGGVALLNGESEGIVRATANSYAEENGVAATGINVHVEGDERDGRVTVEAEVDVQRFFLGAVYTGDWSVSARAVAEVDDERNGQYALIALEEPGMDLSGRPAVIINNGSAMSNGDVTQNGGANVFIVDGTIDAHGVVEPNSNWVAPDGFNGNRPTYTDPLGSTTKPSFAGLTEFTTGNVPDCNGNDDCTLEPGYYKNVNVNVKRTATLGAGIYYFENSKLSLQDTNSRIEGSDVMLYFTGSSAEFIPKNGEVHLEAPATSHYPSGHNGMAVWIENCSDFEWGGNTEFFVSGIFYAPCSHVWIHGTPDGEVLKGQMIVGSINLDGNGTLTMTYENYVDTPRFELYLVE